MIGLIYSCTKHINFLLVKTDMHIKILGCGSIASQKNCSSYLVGINDKYLLMDIGPGAYSQLIKEKVSQEKISAILITHTHADHANDLAAFLWRAMFGTKRKSPLTIIGPKRFKKFFSKIELLYPHIKKAKFKILIKEADENANALNLDGIKIIARQVKHSKYSNAYRVESGGKSIAYSGDTDYCDSILKISESANILILECSMPDGKKVSGHLTPSECGKIAHKSNVKTLVLTHTYPECESKDIKTDVFKYYKGEILNAKDLMVLKC